MTKKRLKWTHSNGSVCKDFLPPFSEQMVQTVEFSGALYLSGPSPGDHAVHQSPEPTWSLFQVDKLLVKRTKQNAIC